MDLPAQWSWKTWWNQVTRSMLWACDFILNSFQSWMRWVECKTANHIANFWFFSKPIRRVKASSHGWVAGWPNIGLKRQEWDCPSNPTAANKFTALLFRTGHTFFWCCASVKAPVPPDWVSSAEHPWQPGCCLSICHLSFQPSSVFPVSGDFPLVSSLSWQSGFFNSSRCI